MEFLELNEGEKVVYLGSMPYILGNGQEVSEEGEELFVNSKVTVQKKFFNKVVEENKMEEKKEKTLEEMNKEELIRFAEGNGIEVDKRKGEEKILAEIKAALDK